MPRRRAYDRAYAGREKGYNMNHPACWEWERPWPMGVIPVISSKEMGIEFMRFHRGRCAVCNDKLAKKSTATYHPRTNTYGAMDDRHDTSAVRGLLCWPCNTFEGHHKGLFYASFNGSIKLNGRGSCNLCNLFDMYRLINPATILGMDIGLGEFSSMFGGSSREAYITEWR
jgi:hypothetical protein